MFAHKVTEYIAKIELAKERATCDESTQLHRECINLHKFFFLTHCITIYVGFFCLCGRLILSSFSYLLHFLTLCVHDFSAAYLFATIWFLQWSFACRFTLRMIYFLKLIALSIINFIFSSFSKFHNYILWCVYSH